MTEQSEQSPEQVEQGGGPPPIFATPVRPADTPLGRQYDVPEQFSGTHKEAVSGIAKQNADILADSSGHPLNNKTHPLHEIYMKNRQDMFEAKAAGDVNPFDKVLADFEAKKEEEAEARQDEAVKLHAELDSLGFEPKKIPENLDDALITTWRMQALSVKSDAQSVSKLKAMMLDEIKGLKNPSGLSMRYEAFLEEGERLKELNPAQYEKDLTSLINWILNERRAQEKTGLFARRKDPLRFGG